MNSIIHPFTKQVYNLYSKQGKQLLKKFIFSYNHLKKTGGSEEGMDKEMKRLKDTKIDSNESLSSNEQEINSPVNIQTDDNIKSNTQSKPSNLSFLNIPDDSSDEENEDSSEDSGEDSREDSTENFHRTIEQPEETDIIAELLTVASDEWEEEFPKDTYGTELPFEEGEEVEIDLPFWEVNVLQQTHKAEIIKIDKIKKTATLKYDNSDEGPEYLEHYQEVPLSRLIKINFFDFNVGEEVEFYTEDSRWEKARIMRIETEIKEVTLRPYVSEIIDVDETDKNFAKILTEINKNDLANFRYTKDSNWEKAVIVSYDSENKKVSLRLVGEEIGVVPQFIRKIEK